MSALLYKIFGENSLKNIPLAATGNVPFLNAAVVELRSLDRCRLFLTTCSAFCNNNPRQATNIWRSRTLLNLEAFFFIIRAPPHLCIPLLLSSASLTGFQPAHLLLPPLRTTPDSSPSLCGTPSALSGLRYDIITASTTIIQQCGRIVAACGSTPPSARRCRLSVSSAAALPPRSRRLPPSAFFCPLPPLMKERLPASPLRSNPQLNTVAEMLYCYRSAPVCAQTHLLTQTRTFLPPVLEALVFFFSASLRQTLAERIVMVQVQQLQKRERGGNIPTGS